MGGYRIASETLVEQTTAVSQADLPVAEIGPWLARTYGAVVAAVAAQGGECAGPPFARFDFHDLDSRCTVEAGFPVLAPIESVGEVRAGTLPAGTAATTLHVGPYEGMEAAYRALAAWVGANGGEPAGAHWEVYLTDPQEQPDPATWQTLVVQPYRPA